MSNLYAFGLCMAAPLVPLTAFWALSFRGRVRIRFWLASQMAAVARWIDSRADGVHPSAADRARAGMED